MSKQSFRVVIAIVIISCVSAIILVAMIRSETSRSDTSEYESSYGNNEPTYNSEENSIDASDSTDIINNDNNENEDKKESGWTDLQEFFLKIDNKYTIQKLRTEAKERGYYTKDITGLPSYMELIDISTESSPKMGDAAEDSYMYEDDHIQVSFYEEDFDGGGKLVCSGKSYYIQRTHMLIECDATGKDVVTKNHLPGYPDEGVKYEEKSGYKSLEDAMKYALEYNAFHE